MDKQLYLIELSESPETDFGKRDFETQGFEQKVFSAVWELQSLVSNGGFQGYFGNQAETAAFAATALRTIGAAHQCATLVEAASARVPTPLPPELDACWDVMHSLPETVTAEFEGLDARFFADPDDLASCLFGFVAAHPNVFGPTPTGAA